MVTYTGNFGIVLLPNKYNTIFSSVLIKDESAGHSTLQDVLPYLALYKGFITDVPAELAHQLVQYSATRLPLVVQFNPITSSAEPFCLWDVINSEVQLHELHQAMFVLAGYAMPRAQDPPFAGERQLLPTDEGRLRRLGYPLDASTPASCTQLDPCGGAIAPWRVTFDKVCFAEFAESGFIKRKLITKIK